jgi:hypothetical protein
MADDDKRPAEVLGNAGQDGTCTMTPGTPLKRAWSAARSARRVGGALSLVLLLGACSHAVPLQPQTDLPSLTDKIAVVVGVHYSPDFQAFEWRESELGDTWIFPLGPASVRLLNSAFAAAFAETRPVSGPPPPPRGDKAVDWIIEPRIEAFGVQIPALKTGVYRASIAYRFTVLTADGAPLASWLVQGEGGKSGELGFEFARWPGEAADLAMQDAARRFIESVSQVPELARWLRAHGRTSTSSS